MNMKKVFLFLLVAVVLFPVFAQNTRAAQQEKDVILVVDTASSMFSYYSDVGTYLSGPFLAENLRIGDTLHIISYGSKPRFEIARRILGDGDIETASARIWLLYPLEPTSDPAAAIAYAEQYVRSIQGGRAKKVYIISDSDLTSQANAAASRLRPNAELYFIRAGSRMGSGQSGAAAKTPVQSGTSGTSSGAAGVSGTGTSSGATAAGEGSAGATAAENQTAQAEDQTAGQSTGNTGDNGITGGTAGAGGTSGTSGTGGTSGETGGTGSTGSTGTGTGTTTGTAAGNSIVGLNVLGIPLPLLIGGILLLLLILLFIIFRMRNLQSSPKKAMAQFTSDGGGAKDAELLNTYASQQAEAALQGSNRPYRYRDYSSQFLTKPPMLNIFVEEQNTAIGRRNIHALKKGATYSVGGGNSDFLIFLVHFPPRLGRLYFDGTNCTFTPLRKEYFPDIGSAQVSECIGKPIRIISDKNYEVFFHFEPYKDPLIEMNQLLNSIRVPEPPISTLGE